MTFSVNGTNAAKNTTATFSQAGAYSFTVTITDAGGLTATSSVRRDGEPDAHRDRGESAGGQSERGRNAAVHGHWEGPVWRCLGGAADVYLGDDGGHDQRGRAVDGARHVVSSGTVTASSGTVNGTATFAVGNAAPTVATAASATPSPVTGTTTNLSVLGADDGGESNLTLHLGHHGDPAGRP